MQSYSSAVESRAALHILKTVRLTRGSARAKYGRVYSVLFPLYKDALRAKDPYSARLFRVYRHPNEQARMLAQIVRFADSNPCASHQDRETRLAGIVGAFQSAVLAEFKQGQKLDDVDGRMKKYAMVLVSLDRGQHAVAAFISANALFRQRQDFSVSMDLAHPACTSNKLLEESESFFERLSVAANSQLRAARRVFPASLGADAQLLNRLAREVIEPTICPLLDYLRPRSDETFLHLTSGFLRQYLRFMDSLDASTSGRVSRTHLADLVSATFTAYFEPYLETERERFEQLSKKEIDGWEQQRHQQEASVESWYMSNVNRQAAKRDFMSSFKRVLFAPVSALPTITWSSSLTSSDGDPNTAPVASSTHRTRHPLAPSTQADSEHGYSTSGNEPMSELTATAAIMKSRLEHIKSLFSIEVALNLVQLARASLERTAVFASSELVHFKSPARYQCENIFVFLVSTLGSQHVKAGFDRALEHLSSYKPHADGGGNQSRHDLVPLVTFLELVNVGDLIQQMLEVFFEREMVKPTLVDPNDFLSPAVKEKRRFEQMLDDRVAAGLNIGINVLMTEVEFILSTTQKPEDFNPGASGSIATGHSDVNPTNAAVSVVETVSGHTRMLTGNADAKVLDVFNQEIGLRLFTTLCKHLKRQRISVSGSIKLIRQVSWPISTGCLLIHIVTSSTTLSSSCR